MALNETDVTNLERGVDAGIQTVLSMAQESMARVNAQQGSVGPFIGFLQALVDHRGAVQTKALQLALLNHPNLGDAEVQITEELPDDA